MRSIYFEEPEQEEHQPVRKYVRVEPTETFPEADGYMDVVEVCASAELREQMVNRALKDLQVWKERYRALKRFSLKIAAVYDALEDGASRKKKSVKGRGKKK